MVGTRHTVCAHHPEIVSCDVLGLPLRERCAACILASLQADERDWIRTVVALRAELAARPTRRRAPAARKGGA